MDIEQDKDKEGLQTVNYDSEIDLLKQELAELDDLFVETKQHLDLIRNVSKNNRVQGALTFLSNQTNTLVQLKTAKIATIKTMIDVKTRRFQNDVKLNEINGGGEGANDAETLRKLVDHLNLNPIQNIVKENKDNIPDQHDEDLEKLRDTVPRIRVPELEQDFIEEEKSDPNTDTYIVCDEYGTLYEILLDKTIVNTVEGVTAEIKITETGDILGFFEGEEIEVLQRAHLLKSQ